MTQGIYVEFCAQQKHYLVQKRIAHIWLLILLHELTAWEGVQSWNYSYSTTDMTWPDARNYCQSFFTDLVAIQNREEINHLNTVIPRNPTYYWIGIRKINNVWTWVGTNKTLDEEAKNWAAGEPTPGAEDCVEIYIKRATDAGRWNNDPCLERSKRALCYLASCKPNSCSGHGQCVETIGSYTCQCYEGFNGPKCQSAVKCEIPKIPRNGTMTCSHPIGNFSYCSTCDVGCVEGFLLNGSVNLQCEASGMWSSPFPTCEAVKCETPKIPRTGIMTCSHPIGNFSYRSTCEVGCVEGFLLNGSVNLQCEASGMWSSPFPTCEAVKCEIPKISRNGTMTCSHPIGNFSYRSTCEVGCMEGFLLNGSVNLQCEASGMWSSPFPTCEAVKCEIPKIPRNGTMTCSHPIGIFSYRSMCDVGCVEGFLLNGSVNLQCEASGMWSSPFPTCEAVKCEIPKISRNGTMTCSHPIGIFSYRSTCEVGCMEGFLLNGSVNLQCEASGMWSLPFPTCEGTLKENNSIKIISIGIASSVCLISVLSAVILITRKVMKKGFSPIST
ncbi:P-selectin-like isoform X3 [Chiloscyllium plagiosum]|uniref:P-selectin-like isoform X3 n=1 Tax=Chiloscyllium plagiosum TaxID=36176 RepID=UPI001CB81526|nr:P-selectin-like isoform X3 [Chiloscyllium plagiosum]